MTVLLHDRACYIIELHCMGIIHVNVVILTAAIATGHKRLSGVYVTVYLALMFLWLWIQCVCEMIIYLSVYLYCLNSACSHAWDLNVFLSVDVLLRPYHVDLLTSHPWRTPPPPHTPPPTPPPPHTHRHKCISN